MRSRSQIKQQLKQVTYRHLQKLLRDNFKKKPSTCAHNSRQALDGRDSHVYYCGYVDADGTPRRVLCDDRMPGCATMAQGCDLWSPHKTKDEIRDEYHQVVQSGDRGVIASRYPDIAALMWVLDDPEGVSVPGEDEVNEVVQQATSKEAQPPVEGWSLRGFTRRLGVG